MGLIYVLCAKKDNTMIYASEDLKLIEEKKKWFHKAKKEYDTIHNKYGTYVTNNPIKKCRNGYSHFEVLKSVSDSPENYRYDDFYEDHQNMIDLYLKRNGNTQKEKDLFAFFYNKRHFTQTIITTVELI